MAAGFNWSVSGFLMPNVLERIGSQRRKELYKRVGAELGTTFKTSFTQELSLAEALDPSNIRRYAAQATGEKFFINPSK